MGSATFSTVLSSVTISSETHGHPGEDGHRTAAMPLGGFLDWIAEAITRAGAAAG